MALLLLYFWKSYLMIALPAPRNKGEAAAIAATSRCVFITTTTLLKKAVVVPQHLLSRHG